MSDSTETQSSRMPQRFSRWQKLLLLAMLVTNVFIYGGIWLISRGSGSGSGPVVSAAGQALELRTAYQQALALALSWQPDAQVVGATASWQLTAGERLTLHRPAWSFSFHSPAVRQIQIVTVDQRGAQAGLQQAVHTAPLRVEPDWSLGSEDLLLTFLSYGGRQFIIDHPGANVHLQLKGEEADRSIWYITAIDPVAREWLTVGVDARSRQVVPSGTAGGGA